MTAITTLGGAGVLTLIIFVLLAFFWVLLEHPNVFLYGGMIIGFPAGFYCLSYGIAHGHAPGDIIVWITIVAGFIGFAASCMDEDL